MTNTIKNAAVQKICTQHALDTSNFEFIAEGNDRIVYTYDSDKVIKFSKRPDSDINQNTREKAFYDNIKGTRYESNFAEVYSCVNGAYLIQEYIPNVGTVSDTDIMDFMSQINRQGIQMHDTKKVNFGCKDSTIIAVDYAGCFLRW